MSKSREDLIKAFLISANNLCRELLLKELLHLKIAGYSYTSNEAVEELGLDNDLIHHLVEDYVAQVMKSVYTFADYLLELKIAQKANQTLDYVPLRELAHKNLGVARNLRIKDGEKLLYELMTKDDLDYLEVCIQALQACAIKLKPVCAYNTVTMIKIKKTL
ncbi:MAG: hypothetical protein PHU40_02490 [Sulfurimonas sp.]|nr:hypothetical protein [Sulfurimonas sp.]